MKTSPAIDHSLEYARQNWPILSALAVGLMLWGGMVVKVEALEEKSKLRDSDHDVIVRIETEVTTIQTTLVELKVENKELSKEIRKLEDQLDDNFDRIFEALQQRNRTDAG